MYKVAVSDKVLDQAQCEVLTELREVVRYEIQHN